MFHTLLSIRIGVVMGSASFMRTRWAAIGAACAVTLGGGTFGVVRAVQTSGERATYVPVTPARVLDTRTDIGAVDILDATPVLLTVTGSVPTAKGTMTVVPAGASGVVVNITAVEPTDNGFVSLRPGDTSGEPDVSTLNVTKGGTFPNGATITLPTSGASAGQVQIWFEGYGTGGRTDMLIDVVGYYTDHNHDDRYYTKTEADSALVTSLDGLEAPAPTQLTRAIATTGSNGYDSVVAIGRDGNPVIAFTGDGRLKLAACADARCSTSTLVTVDPTTVFAGDLDMAIGTNGNPFIAYRDFTNGNLMTAACGNATCSSNNTITTVDSSANQVGDNLSMAIGTNGLPVISYQDATAEDLKVAACSNATCSTSTLSVVDSADRVGDDTSIAISALGFPIIAYNDRTHLSLKVAACNDLACAGANETYTTVDGSSQDASGTSNSIAIGINGFPVIAHYASAQTELRLTFCLSWSCSAFIPQPVELDGTAVGQSAGLDTSLVIGPHGSPIVSYYDLTNSSLKMATCYDGWCNFNTNITVDDSADVGRATSMAIGRNGVPVITYYNLTNQDLLFAYPWWAIGGH